MLTFNFSRVMKARGIEKPYAFLLKKGYSINTAYRVTHGIGAELRLDAIERYCELFNCTPNDLLEWTPDKSEVDIEHHPLKPLMREKTKEDITQMLNALPLEKLEQIKKIIDENGL